MNKSTNVFYYGYQDYFYDLAGQLAEQKNWNPAYISIVESRREALKKRFPKAILHEHYDAVKGRLPSEVLESELVSVCPLTLKKLYQSESIALNIMDRYDVHTNTFSFRERERLFIRLASFWLTLIDRFDPKYVIFEQEPHGANDYVLYCLCKELGITPIMFTATSFWPYCFGVSLFEEGSEGIQNRYSQLLKEGIQPFLQEDAKNYLTKVRGEASEAIKIHAFEMIEQFEGAMVKKITLSDLFLKYRKNLMGILGNLNLKKRWNLFTDGHSFKSDQKVRGKTFHDSDMSYLSFIYYKIITIRKKNKIKNLYNKIASSSIQNNSPYIYLALQYQPEKTTAPMGDVFVNQLYLIDLIAKSMPKNWKLLVKEHPAQFVSNYAVYGENERSIDFYKDILKHENVDLIALDVPSFDLIDGASLVASITGTNVWEAVTRGKPGLIFGYPWYKDCHGVFHIRSKKDLNKVFKLLDEGFVVDANKIDLFMSAVMEQSVPAILGGPRTSEFFDITPEQNVSNHIKIINKVIS